MYIYIYNICQTNATTCFQDATHPDFSHFRVSIASNNRCSRGLPSSPVWVLILTMFRYEQHHIWERTPFQSNIKCWNIGVEYIQSIWKTPIPNWTYFVSFHVNLDYLAMFHQKCEFCTRCRYGFSPSPTVRQPCASPGALPWLCPSWRWLRSPPPPPSRSAINGESYHSGWWLTYIWIILG